jgi:uncharacterized protein YdhG (YjbR/CyaY superfamily)
VAKSEFATVNEYLAELPKDKADAIKAVRKVIRANLPDGYKESMAFGTISYCVPLSRYPNTYNKQPLGYVALAAQKNYCALYLMSAYGYPPHAKALKDAFKAAGKKLDMGKSCVRFRSADDLELNVIGELIASIPPERWIEIYETSRKTR